MCQALAKSFMCVNSFNPHDNPAGQILLLSPFYRQETEAQHLVNCPEALSWEDTGQMGSQFAWLQSSCFPEKQDCPAPFREILRNLALLLPPEEPVAFLCPGCPCL